MGPLKELSLSLLYKAFLRPLLTYVSHRWFPFLCVTNSIKLEHLHRAASRAISGCLLFSPISPLLSVASLLPLRIALTHFALSSHEKIFHYPNSFPILGLARLGVTPRLCRSFWKSFVVTHPLMFPSSSLRKILFACPPSPH